MSNEKITSKIFIKCYIRSCYNRSVEGKDFCEMHLREVEKAWGKNFPSNQYLFYCAQCKVSPFDEGNKALHSLPHRLTDGSSIFSLARQLSSSVQQGTPFTSNNITNSSTSPSKQLALPPPVSSISPFCQRDSPSEQQLSSRSVNSSPPTYPQDIPLTNSLKTSFIHQQVSPSLINSSLLSCQQDSPSIHQAVSHSVSSITLPCQRDIPLTASLNTLPSQRGSPLTASLNLPSYQQDITKNLNLPSCHRDTTLSTTTSCAPFIQQSSPLINSMASLNQRDTPPSRPQVSPLTVNSRDSPDQQDSLHIGSSCSPPDQRETSLTLTPFQPLTITTSQPLTINSSRRGLPLTIISSQPLTITSSRSITITSTHPITINSPHPSIHQVEVAEQTVHHHHHLLNKPTE